jgi:hypothetical protein
MSSLIAEADRLPKALQPVSSRSPPANSPAISANAPMGTLTIVRDADSLAMNGRNQLTAAMASLSFNHEEYGVKVPSRLGNRAADEVPVDVHIVAEVSIVRDK